MSITLACLDGEVPCAREALRSAKTVLADMMEQEGDLLPMPFYKEDVAAALSVLPARVLIPATMSFERVAKVLDFWGATDALEALMLRRWHVRFDVGDKVSVINFFRDTLRYRTTKHRFADICTLTFHQVPFWSDFTDQVLPTLLTPDMALSLVPALSGVFAPSWVIAVVLERIPGEFCTPDFLVALAAAPWGDDAHMWETGQVLSLLKNACFHADRGSPVYRMLHNIEIAANPLSYFPVGERRVPHGSLLVYFNPQRSSVLVDLITLGRGNALRRVCRGLSMSLTADGELTIVIRLKLLDTLYAGDASRQPLDVRVASMRHSSPTAEEWYRFGAPTVPEFPRYFLESRRGRSAAGKEGVLQQRLQSDGGTHTLRIDLFYDVRPLPLVL